MSRDESSRESSSQPDRWWSEFADAGINMLGYGIIAGIVYLINSVFGIEGNSTIGLVVFMLGIIFLGGCWILIRPAKRS